MHNERFEELAALQAMDILTGEESAEFARHLGEGCPTCEELVAEFRFSASALSVTAEARQPPAEIRQKILASLGPSRSTAPSRPSVMPAWLFAAAAALLVVFVGLDDARLRRQHEDLRHQTADLSVRLSNAEKELARKDLRVRVLASEDVRILSLNGQGPQPDARARVFWSEKAKRAVLLAGNLAPLSPDKQYELWVFDRGKPMAAGVFDSDREGRALLESPDLASISAAQNFAVTIEPRGGVAQPTGPIVLVGSPAA